MARGKKCVAMLLAGGQGSRLGTLTRDLAKPAVPFGGKYRIIDFTLSNCTNSGIDTIGVLTQYEPLRLHSYLGIGQPWDLDRMVGGITILPPYTSTKRGEWYKGTANAVYQNLRFIEQYDPENVLVLSGDHVYKMDYAQMVGFHHRMEAAITIAVIEVPWEEAGRFGIVTTSESGRIRYFAEKPAQPTSNLASMGVYVFNWDVLRRYLIEDEHDPESSHDFGKDVIPRMLRRGERMFAYRFGGYWKDVGTVESLWEAHMDLLEEPPRFDLCDADWRIYSRNPVEPPHYVSPTGQVNRSIVSEGCVIHGQVAHAVLFYGVYVGPGAVVRDSVVMPYARIEANAQVNRAIVAEGAVVSAGSVVGYGDPAKVPVGVRGSRIAVVAEDTPLAQNTTA